MAGVLDLAASFIPGGQIVSTAIGAGAEIAEKRKQEQAANRLYEQYAGEIARAQARTTATEATTRQRTIEDYNTKLNNYLRSQHLQRVMAKDELAQRGITSPTESSIGRTTTGNIRAGQEAERGGLETWQQRQLADIGTQAAQTQENLLSDLAKARHQKELGQYNWSDVLRGTTISPAFGGYKTTSAPSTYAGMAQALAEKVW